MFKKLALVLAILATAFAGGAAATHFSGLFKAQPAAAAAQKDPSYPILKTDFHVIGWSRDWLDLSYYNYVLLVKLRVGDAALNCVLYNHNEGSDSTGASFTCPDAINPVPNR